MINCIKKGLACASAIGCNKDGGSSVLSIAAPKRPELASEECQLQKKAESRLETSFKAPTLPAAAPWLATIICFVFYLSEFFSI